MDTLQRIQQAEQTLYQAQLASDVATLDTLLADELLFIGPDGNLYTKAMDLETHRSGQLRLTTLIAHEPVIHVLPQLAIVSVIVDLQGISAEQSISGRFRYMRVWAQQCDTWRIIAGSCTQMQS